MKKLLLILTSLFVVAAFAFVSCSKSEGNDPGANNGCPTGYSGTNCNIPWYYGISSVWKRADGQIVTIAPSSASNPTDFDVYSYFEGDHKGNSYSVTIHGHMIDSSSFVLDSTMVYSFGDKLYMQKGDGKLGVNNQQITGTMSFMVITRTTQFDENHQPYDVFDTTYSDTTYSLVK